jgi:hypothetical protein
MVTLLRKFIGTISMSATLISMGFGQCPVAWTDVVNATTTIGTGGAMTNLTSSVGQFKAGARSINELASTKDGWVQFEVSDKSKSVFGLSSNPTTTSFSDIDYAFFTDPELGLAIFELGKQVLPITFSRFAVGDKLKITRTTTTSTSGKIIVNVTYQNITTGFVYTSKTPSSAALRVKVSLGWPIPAHLNNTTVSFCPPKQ